MKKIHIFTAILTLVVSIAFAGPSAALAQYNIAYPTYPATYTPTVPAPYNPSISGVCVNLVSGLYKGLTDVTTGGQVSVLQRFLIEQKYLAIAAPTGYFGNLTYQALYQYQYAHELPPNGTADVATRTSIQAFSCGNNYNYGAPVLTSLSISSGPIGTSVTVYGSGFDYSNNIVNFGGVKVPAVYSYNGTSLTFVVPQIYTPLYNNYNYVTPTYSSQYCIYPYNNCGSNTGIYPVSVTTTRGTSNSLSFTLTSGNCYNSSNNGYTNGIYNPCYTGPISISNVSGPTYLNTGSQGVWSLTLYNPNSNYVTVSAKWGDENLYGNYNYASQQTAQSSSVQGQQTVTFTHTYQTSGNYTVTFTATDNRGATANASATVNVSGSIYNNPGQSYLSSISPNSASVGAQVVLYGSGFTPTGNTVHFSYGGMLNLSSNNGTTIYYTIPRYISVCDMTSNSGAYCAAPDQLVSPGTYSVYVSNVNGQTSTMYFTVTY